MKQTSYRLGALITTAVLVAACGSSSSSRSVPAASAGGTSATTANPSGGSGYGGGSAGSQASASATAVVAKKNKLGTILAAGPKKLTVYVFSADSGSTSKCSGACAKVWPPVPASGTASATPPAQTSLIGTTTRADGTKQLTYKGQPVYYFAKDKDDGDAYGQGINHFGGSWSAVAPNGAKITKS